MLPLSICLARQIIGGCARVFFRSRAALPELSPQGCALSQIDLDARSPSSFHSSGTLLKVGEMVSAGHAALGTNHLAVLFSHLH